MRDPVGEQRAVRQVGQRIVQGLPAELVLQAPARLRLGVALDGEHRFSREALSEAAHVTGEVSGPMVVQGQKADDLAGPAAIR